MRSIEEEKPAIQLNQVSFAYGSKLILDQCNMSVATGQVVGLVGLSGSGKTTLMRLINGAMTREGHYTYTGEIIIEGKDVRSIQHLNRSIGTVYQDTDNQLIFTTVIDEIVFGMENYALSKEVMTKRLKEVTETLGLESLLEKNPNNLSGGEKQLVVLASILCLEVNIIFLDECMSGVDQGTRAIILAMIDKLKKKKVTVIMIEHDFDNLALADLVYKIENKKIIPIDLKRPSVG